MGTTFFFLVTFGPLQGKSQKAMMRPDLGSHSHANVIYVLVIKKHKKGLNFGLVVSSTFLQKRVLFRLSFRVSFFNLVLNQTVVASFCPRQTYRLEKLP